MKGAIFLFMAFAALSYVAIEAAPAKGSTKAALKKKPSCTESCGDEYTPVCAQDEDTAKSYSFGNQCVMDLHNCEHQASLKFISKGECPGGGGVRLS